MILRVNRVVSDDPRHADDQASRSSRAYLRVRGSAGASPPQKRHDDCPRCLTLFVVAFVLLLGRLPAECNGEEVSFAVEDIRTISLDGENYHGWPTLIRRSNGELLVVCSGGRESHVCPFGRVDLIRSYDNGATWTFSRTILDGPSDDRDAGLLETSKGTLLVTTFTSLAYQPILEKAVASQDSSQPTMSSDQLSRWQAAHGRIADGQHSEHLGCWMIRSDDNGQNWSAAERVPVNSPHGPINLQNGRLLYAGVNLWSPNREVGICTSEDDGRTWSWLADLPVRNGDAKMNYHELHAVEAANGRIVVHIRNHNTANNRETLQTHSDDGGKTWVEPYSIGVWGLPSHLLRLSDGRLLMSYGHRRAPLGNQARISNDNGDTWSEPMAFHADATSGDLGYPSTIEISAGQLVTVWYERMRDSHKAKLRMARWSLN